MFKKIVDWIRYKIHQWRMKRKLAELRKRDPFVY